MSEERKDESEEPTNVMESGLLRTLTQQSRDLKGTDQWFALGEELEMQIVVEEPAAPPPASEAEGRTYEPTMPVRYADMVPVPRRASTLRRVLIVGLASVPLVVVAVALATAHFAPHRLSAAPATPAVVGPVPLAGTAPARAALTPPAAAPSPAAPAVRPAAPAVRPAAPAVRPAAPASAAPASSAAAPRHHTAVVKRPARAHHKHAHAPRRAAH